MSTRRRFRRASVREARQADTVPIGAGHRMVALISLVILPLLVLVAAVPSALRYGWGPSWLDVALGVSLYAVAIFGITAGYHRCFTHRSFTAREPLKVALAVAGGIALEGPVALWAAEHRRHHRYSDAPGDPHSPWRFGTGRTALLRGLIHAQVGWFVTAPSRSDRERYVPDLLADPILRRIDRYYPVIAAGSLLLPAVIGGLATSTWHGAITAFLWAGLVRYALVHHITWSVNSICHAFGDQHYPTRGADQSRDVRWVALLTFGEGWHNLHHANPNSARHGGLPGQHDPTATLIRVFERLDWAYDVHWPIAPRYLD
ncbi:acyl-CoA desaturase [Nocardia sp. NBC_01327]|uniref:acyl-CoA desaturase n=1 Tax=Nocardia sp. NBC_01327 TaxID=2903593 RepID=UPI002E0E50F7|nr:acyl-CoA desaturase [Nocardia sp. NBC_01327]